MMGVRRDWEGALVAAARARAAEARALGELRKADEDARRRDARIPDVRERAADQPELEDDPTAGSR